MSYNFHLPDLAEGMTEAEVVDWKVKVGDIVTLDQPVVEVMSDKATVEIPSPRAGTIAKLNYGPGEMCAVGQVLFIIDTEVGSQVSESSSAKNPVVTRPSAEVEEFRFEDTISLGPNDYEEVSETSPVFIDASTGRARVLATPATRRKARQLRIELSKVTGTGRNGRITTADLMLFHDESSKDGTRGRPQKKALISIPSLGKEERIPFRGMRKRIAENMSRSVYTATHFTYVEEVDTTDLVSVRDRAKIRGAERGIKLTYLPFVVKAVVSALKRHPSLNSSLDEKTNEIVLKKYYNIGIATQGPKGLTVTVVRNADSLSIFEIATEISRLAEAVQSGTATRDDLSGSTFTISSLGRLGGLMATPIINFPEVGILGVHKMEQRPSVLNNEIVIRWKMNLAISLDHRLVDGFDGAMFVQDVKSLLEDPTSMFMEMV